MSDKLKNEALEHAKHCFNERFSNFLIELESKLEKKLPEDEENRLKIKSELFKYIKELEYTYDIPWRGSSRL